MDLRNRLRRPTWRPRAPPRDPAQRLDRLGVDHGAAEQDAARVSHGALDALHPAMLEEQDQGRRVARDALGEQRQVLRGEQRDGVLDERFEGREVRVLLVVDLHDRDVAGRVLAHDDRVDESHDARVDDASDLVRDRALEVRVVEADHDVLERPERHVSLLRSTVSRSAIVRRYRPEPSRSSRWVDGSPAADGRYRLRGGHCHASPSWGDASEQHLRGPWHPQRDVKPRKEMRAGGRPGEHGHPWDPRR